MKNTNRIDVAVPRISTDVEGQEHIPIEVAIEAAFLFYRHKFLSRAKDKNLQRLSCQGKMSCTGIMAFLGE